MQLVAASFQVLTWAGFAALIAALAQGPVFAPYADGEALLKFSVAHLSQRLVPCRQLTPSERQALPPTRRAFEVCERGRSPTLVMLWLDGEILVEKRIEPAGLRDDGRSYYLAYFPVPAGQYLLKLALRDSPRERGYDLEREYNLDLAGGESAVFEVGDDGAELKTFPKESS